MKKEHSNTCDLVGFRQGYNAPAVCSCGAESDSDEKVCRHGHKTLQIGCISCALLHKRHDTAGADHGFQDMRRNQMFANRARGRR